MGQVPSYLIIGDGRLARHFKYYLSLLHIPCVSWHRAQSTKLLQHLVQINTVILLLIADDAIAAFSGQHDLAGHPGLVHCSATVAIDGISFAHPLMSFNTDLYDASLYPTIPFAIAEKGPSLAELLPGLANPSFRLPSAKRDLYHALCVMGGNFSTMLWQQFFDGMQQSLGIDRALLLPYVNQVSQNTMQSDHAVTGPLVRGDQGTIAKHLNALGDDPLAHVYRAMLNLHQEANSEST